MFSLTVHRLGIHNVTINLSCQSGKPDEDIKKGRGGVCDIKLAIKCDLGENCSRFKKRVNVNVFKITKIIQLLCYLL